MLVKVKVDVSVEELLDNAAAHELAMIYSEVSQRLGLGDCWIRGDAIRLIVNRLIVNKAALKDLGDCRIRGDAIERAQLQCRDIELPEVVNELLFAFTGQTFGKIKH